MSWRDEELPGIRGKLPDYLTPVANLPQVLTALVEVAFRLSVDFLRVLVHRVHG
jgi:hypothetical protein